MNKIRFFTASLVLFAVVGPLVPPLMMMAGLAGTTQFFAPLAIIPFSYLFGAAPALIYGAATVTTNMLLISRSKKQNLHGWKLHAISMAAACTTVMAMDLAFGNLVHNIRFAIENSEQTISLVQLLGGIWRLEVGHLLLFGVPNLVCSLLISIYFLPGYIRHIVRNPADNADQPLPSVVVRTSVGQN